MEKGVSDEVERVCKEILAPMVRADGGVMYLVSISADDIHIHLAGACSGCPGSQFTRDRLMEPVIGSAAPKAKLKVTTGYRVPEGARKVE